MRIIGGRAYTAVAMMPTSGPIPQSIMTGIRYTKIGMVCMVSRTGRRIDSKALLWEARIPKAKPTTTVNAPAVSTWLRVSMVTSQTPPMPAKASPTRARSATRNPAVK